MKIIIPRRSIIWTTFQHHIGEDAELVMSRILYDPKYGVIEKIEDFTQIYRA
jgi:hypothetical protein